MVSRARKTARWHRVRQIYGLHAARQAQSIKETPRHRLTADPAHADRLSVRGQDKVADGEPFDRDLARGCPDAGAGHEADMLGAMLLEQPLIVMPRDMVLSK